MKKNNKGFSYIELVLVLGIIAVMLSVMALSIGLVSRTNVNKACDNLATLLSQARSETMAKGMDDGSLCIQFEDETYYYYIGSPYDSEFDEKKTELVSFPVELKFTINSGADVMYSMSDGDMIVVRYYPSSGAFYLSNVPVDAVSGADFINSFIFLKGDQMRTIQCYTPTGKVEIK